MNRFRFFQFFWGFFATSLLSTQLPAAQPVAVNSRITAVTVYTDRAVITRTGETAIASPGTLEFIFDRLPDHLVDQSVRVAGSGTAAATLLDVTTRVSHVETSPDSRVKSLMDSIDAEKRKLLIVDQRDGVLRNQAALIDKIENAVTAPPTKEGTAPRPTPDEWQAIMSFSDASRTRIGAEQRTLHDERTLLNAKIRALEKQLEELRASGLAPEPDRRAYKSVVVRVSAARAGALTFTLSYLVEDNASWTPAYDARLHVDERSVELNYHGLIEQSTGEDWTHVALTLSTARPSLGGGAPVIEPWFVDVRKPDLRRRDYAADNAMEISTFNAAAPSASNVGALVKEARKAEMTAAAATVEAQVTSASFRIEAPASVPSDNTTQKVQISRFKLPAHLQYQATPRLVEAAFLTAYMNNSTDFPLLGGKLSAFLGDSFIATSNVKTVMPGEKFHIDLGADDAIGIKRKVVNRFAEDTGLTNKGRRVTYDVVITVTNHKKSTERIFFKEPVPVSRNEKIVVKLHTPAERDIGTLEKPKDVNREGDNLLTWRFDLKGGEKREIPLKYSVEYPGDVDIIGLE